MNALKVAWMWVRPGVREMLITRWLVLPSADVVDIASHANVDPSVVSVIWQLGANRVIARFDAFRP